MASGKPMDKRFGERVRIRRDKNEWTQPHMAEQLEMHPTVLAKIEKACQLRIPEEYWGSKPLRDLNHLLDVAKA